MRNDLRWTPLPLLALFVAGCVDIPDPRPQTPPDDGDSMQPPEGDDDGDEPSTDPSTPPPVMRLACQVGGQTFPHGSSVASGDSCNQCTCYEGELVCTENQCPPQACEGFLETSDGVCSRGADDPCIGQDPDCSEPEPEPEPEPARLACDAAGQTFPDGAEVSSGDSCNTCSCDDGSVLCTEIACDEVFCAEFVEEPDGVCARFPLDPCIAQDPDCGSEPAPSEPLEPTEP